MDPSLTVQVGASCSVRCNECMTLCLHVPTRLLGMLFKHEINAPTLIRNNQPRGLVVRVSDY